MIRSLFCYVYLSVIINLCFTASAEPSEAGGDDILVREARSIVTISAEVGENVLLPCNIESSGNLKVTWMDPHRNLLSENEAMTKNDARMYIEKPKAEDWNLGIYGARLGDSGEYLCQINTTPVISHRVYLDVTESRTDDSCRECVAFGRRHRPNEEFTHRDGCREYHCDCECSGKWDCPGEKIKNVCEPECSTCWAGNEVREGNKPFKFQEECYLYDCFCKCDGGWDCPKEKTVDTCRTNVKTGCYYCDVHGEKIEGNTHFKHKNGCIEYDCTCKCDGGWDCPGERAVDTCKVNTETGCTRCQVYGEEYEGNTYFNYVNGCIEYTCACNCDGSWSCPGENAVDLCRTNATTGCYYCDVYDYLYQGRSQFPLVKDCYEYLCDCSCDGGWTCKNSIGTYVCDQYGNEPQECNTCSIDGNSFRGGSRFFYQRGCVKYMCTCDCEGRHSCPGSEAHMTCGNVDQEYIITLSSSGGGGGGGGGVHTGIEHTRPPRQTHESCRACVYDGKTYSPYENFKQQSGCNIFSCTCQCNGKAVCPTDKIINSCRGPSSRVNFISSGSTTSAGGSAIDVSRGSGVSTCRDCTYLGVTYEGGSEFQYERGCFRYKCFCDCNGGYQCLSEDSKYICPGKPECIKCDTSEKNGPKEPLIEPNTDFSLRRGCVLYDKCRCKCDGGWSCDDGEYTCDLCQGCSVDGNKYHGNTTFQMSKGCDLYTNCFCGCDSKWTCSGEGIKDLCPTCRKCKIGDDYYDGDTTFEARVGCTRYERCECKCDGTYTCRRGVYECDNRGDQPVEGQCTDCIHGRRRYRPGQSFDYRSDCSIYRGCQCKCGTTHCREIIDTCGTCRTCQLDGTEYKAGSKFSTKSGCTIYKDCDCFCNGTWNCDGENAVDTCNACRKCNVEDKVYEAYSRFTLDRKCWKYQCFCACDGSTRCPSDTVINTCTTPDNCQMCEVKTRQIPGNSHFRYDLNGMVMSCRCNCDGSHVCMAEWLYIRSDVSISGSGIGSGAGSCLSCIMDGRNYKGNSNYTISRSGVDMNCQCNCNGGYYCSGIVSFEGAGCRRCAVYNLRGIEGDSIFSLVYRGFKLACSCACDGSYVCLGADKTSVISCTKGIGCLTQTCGQCLIDGVRFNGGDQFGTVYNGRQLTCDCGCDGSYYCEGSGGLIISCVGGRCTELGCSSCSVFGKLHNGNSNFDAYYKGLKLNCLCQCGGNYICYGSSNEVIVSCINGVGCLDGTCNACVVNGRRFSGRDTFRFDYNGIDMECTCACDGSYYCKGVSELIEISCIDGTCTRLGCQSCSVFGLTHPGETKFNIVSNGLELRCECSCDTSYLCRGSTNEVIIRCVNGRGCLSSTSCRPCVVNGQRYGGRSTFRSTYKGADVLCTCGCDSSSFCRGVTTSVEVSCIDGTCKRIGCQECNLFGKEYLGLTQLDTIYQGIKVTCECDCDGGYICKGSNGVTVVTCVNGIGPGCLTPHCQSCVVDGKQFLGRSTFRFLYRGIDMQCTCSCDTSYYCVGVNEVVELKCIGGICSTIGCKSCSLYGNEYGGVSEFSLIYAGLALTCECRCNGWYECFDSSRRRVVYCRDGEGCLSQTCDTCIINGEKYNGGSTGIADQYNGIDVTCTCGCDGSVVCIGVTTKITISCIGGVCSTVGCSNCRIFGREYNSFSNFDIIYSGYKLDCQCDCSGGYVCRGSSTEVTCQDNRGCLPQVCNKCSHNGKEYRGRSVFKYLHNGIDFSCKCGCDGSVFCEGVTEVIELRCIGGTCRPVGCQNCNVFGNQIATMSKFDLIYGGLKLACDCSCTGGFVCRGTSGSVELECAYGNKDCVLPSTCRSCFRNNREILGGSKYADVYEGIDVTCTCGCDGSSFCVGVTEVIEIKCIGNSCSPINCRTCSIFGQEYAAISKFDIIYKGVRLNCRCSCDSSYICSGSTGEVIVNCPPGENCLPSTCRDCFVDRIRRSSRSTFAYVYEGIDMTCTCGCDGTSYCVGVTEVIEISCDGSECSPINCRTCNIFAVDYRPLSKFDIIYQGVRLNCTCACDSSYVCTGSTGEVVVECISGRGCFPRSACTDCIVDGSRYNSRSTFSYQYRDIDMTCTCGCDGTSYCEGVTEVFELSCIDGSCFRPNCRSCSLFGQDYRGDSSFPLVYKGVKMQCECRCDTSYRCEGSSSVIECAVGMKNCLPRRCRKCRVNGQRYDGGMTFEIDYHNVRLSCICSCDSSYYCEGTTTDVQYSCRRGQCTLIGGCRTCNYYGKDYPGDSRTSFVYRGNFVTCHCKCDGSTKCTSSDGSEIITCTDPGKSCLVGTCGTCRAGGQEYAGRTEFDTVYKGRNMRCTCGCDGSYFCRCKDDNSELTCDRSGVCKLGGCNACVSDGRQRKVDEEFEKMYDGIRMNCLCACDGSYRCQGVDVRITISCTGNACNLIGCRSCIVDGREQAYGAVYETRTGSLRKSCRCECDGSSTCTTVKEPSCLSCVIDGKTYKGHSRQRVYKGTQPFICDCFCNGTGKCTPELPACQKCVIGGKQYPGNTNFAATLNGIKMQCSCTCRGSHECLSEYRKCTSASGCVDICHKCVIDGRDYAVNKNFDATVDGLRMTCSCDCSGAYECISDTRRCTSAGGCVDVCRKCAIGKSQYSKNNNFEAIVDGSRMTCSCECSGAYECISDTRRCTSTGGCVDVCRKCAIGNKQYSKNNNFEAIVNGLRMTCSCECSGAYECISDTRRCTSAGGCVDVCRKCAIGNKQYSKNKNFEAIVDGLRMTCSCDCSGAYECISDTRRCTSTGGCVDVCRKCAIGKRQYSKNNNFEAIVDGSRMTCSCECSGAYECISDTRRCTSTGGCVDVCRKCAIGKRQYSKNNNFEAIVDGSRMTCSCECSGAYECISDTRRCTSAGGCVDVCRKCAIGNKQYSKNKNFEAIVNGLRMTCSCECSGAYECISDTRKCTSTGGCVDVCRKCAIGNGRYGVSSNFDAVLEGMRMRCSCECSGAYECISDTRRCTSAGGCVDVCRKCEIGNKQYSKNKNFEALVDGSRMTCSCECSGAFECVSDTRRCTSADGCVDVCRNCEIGNGRYGVSSDFHAVLEGKLMTCSCACNGAYDCSSDTRRCTSAGGCVDVCQKCEIGNRQYSKNKNFEALVDGLRMTCSCECSGAYECISDTRRCTSASGCVDVCQKCVIGNGLYNGNSNFKAVLEGTIMQCTCDCLGGYTCTSETKTCTSVSGCVDKCQKCIIDGQSFDGNSQFQTEMQGTRMNCKCDCSNGYECTGGTIRCTSWSGCVDSCAGCEIEGKTYPGNTQQFQIFHKGYGVHMKCDCSCGGSYTCRGVKRVTSCTGPGCKNPGGCVDCVINNIKYSSESTFKTVIDGIDVTCTCACNGGYRCVGKTTSTTCTGPGCSNTLNCGSCVIGGNTYPGNGKFQLEKNGVTMKCYCRCDGSFTCRGQKTTSVCIGAGCDGECAPCNVDGRQVEGGSRFETVRDGVNLECQCECGGRYECQGTVTKPCTGPGCRGTGCRRCVINDKPYSGNTRFSFTKGSIVYNCTCYCDGSYTCKGSTGIETSCVGESCAAQQCRSCQLDGRAYELDARFHLTKNNFVMNCVCECDGAYRCFSISGTCRGSDCDDYGCSSCTIDGQRYKGNSQFELASGSTCTCDCSGQYSCRSKSIVVQCVGANCGDGGCRRCNVDGFEYAGNTRFQFTKYGLAMSCACNCDSSFMCRGYQIISTGESDVDLGCKNCEIEGRTFNGNTRFQTLVKGVRSVCSCNCDGIYSCSGSTNECRDCEIGYTRYRSNSEFTLREGAHSILCRCDCNGDFVCEGRGECQGSECSAGGCRDCLIFGKTYATKSKFTTYSSEGIEMLCECHCNGGYSCKGYRHVTNILLPAKKEKACATCYVAGETHEGNTKFKVQRGRFLIDCECGCDGIWQCPMQTPQYANTGNDVNQKGYVSDKVVQSRFSIAGSQVFTSGSTSSDSRSRLVYTGIEESSTVFGEVGCRNCKINNKEYDGNTAFVLRDGCLRWTCSCDCSGGWNCTSVEGSDCNGPLDPFESKTCSECRTPYGTFENGGFKASDECYKYTCTCNCDGSWECPPQLTIKTCTDSSVVHNRESGTCRQCIIGRNAYNHGDSFEYVDQCIKYRCKCSCDGSYICPPLNAIRVCRTGSGSAGRIPGSGSETIARTQKTFVNIRPVGIETAASGGSTSSDKQASGLGFDDGSSSSSSRYSGSSSSAGTYSHSSSSSGSTDITASGRRTSSGTKTSGIGYDDGSSSSHVSRTSNSGGVYPHSSSSTSGSSESGYSYGSNRRPGTGSGSSTGSGTSYRESIEQGTRSSSRTGTSSGSSSGLGTSHRSSSSSGTSYRGSIERGTSSSSKTGTSSSSSTGSGTSHRSSSGSSNGSVSGSSRGSSSVVGDRCGECFVNNETIRGGRDFTYRQDCYEFNCECFCDGSYVCPAEKTTNFCNVETKTRDNIRKTTGCTVGNRTYKTKTFSYTKDCLRFSCRCYNNGSYNCDSRKTKRIC